MRRLLILLFAVLITVTVPVQGWAVVAGGQCMALGHHDGGAGGQGHSHPADAAAPDHDHTAHSHSDDQAAKHLDDNRADDTGTQPHCAPCAACCVSASIAGPVGFPFLSAPSGARYFLPLFPPPGVRPDGIDRPPIAL